MSRPARFRNRAGLTRTTQTQPDSAAASTDTDHRTDSAHSSNHTDRAKEAETATPLLYTPEEAATLLRVRASWLRRKAATRTIPCRFLGKHLRFAHADLEAITALNTHPPRSR